MSDFLAEQVDRHTDALPVNSKWYLLGALIVVALFFTMRK